MVQPQDWDVVDDIPSSAKPLRHPSDLYPMQVVVRLSRPAALAAGHYASIAALQRPMPAKAPRAIV